MLVSHSKPSMFEVLELPSTSGANRNHVDRYGSTPLMEADLSRARSPSGDMIGAESIWLVVWNMFIFSYILNNHPN